MPALLFGSISTLSDSSEIQRETFNEAFAANGLDWRWEGEEYRGLLEKSGGKDRVAEYAEAKGEDVDADAIHQDKSQRFQRRLAEGDLSPRPGVAETLKAAKDQGYKVAFVTTTARENVTALLTGLGPDISESDFDLVVDVSAVDAPKPDKAAYAYALETLGVRPEESVAIEDNLGGLEAAEAAGVRTIAFPNQNTAAHDFGAADRQVDHVSFDDVKALVDGQG